MTTFRRISLDELVNFSANFVRFEITSKDTNAVVVSFENGYVFRFVKYARARKLLFFEKFDRKFYSSPPGYQL